MHGRNRRDALSDRSVDEQFAGLHRQWPQQRLARPQRRCLLATLPNPDAAVGPLRAARRMICCKDKPGRPHGHCGLAAGLGLGSMKPYSAKMG